MHRSRIAVALIDHPADVFDASVRFWAGALGRDVADPVDPADPYRPLGEIAPALKLDLQRIDGPPRIHLDIETDDVEAEVRRLEALGATRVVEHESWWQMSDPGGLLLCVVPVQTKEFAELATAWP